MRTVRDFLFTALSLPLMLWGAEGTPIGDQPHETWKDNRYGYFILFNSLIDDQVTLVTETTNRQADTCIEASSFTLSGEHIPLDPVVDKAYLIWMGAVDPAKFNDPTDNAVHLKFVREGGNYEWETDIVAGETPKMLGDTTDPFLFESISFNSQVVTGCSETETGTSGLSDIAFFTYRVEVTDFFDKIVNEPDGGPLFGGEAFAGSYTVSGLDCTEDDRYKCSGTMVSNWALLLVYRSGSVRGQNIFLYRGFSMLQGETMTVPVSGLVLPEQPTVYITALTAEGDTGLASPTQPPELMYLRGQKATATYILTNECNPYVSASSSYEIFNSISSVFGRSSFQLQKEPICVTGGTEGDYLGIDVDTFRLSTADDVNLNEHFPADATGFDLTLSVNQDAILANLLLVAVDTKNVDFEIPPEAIAWPQGREKHYCSCQTEEDLTDSWCEGKPLYFLIKVQNWGERDAENVIVTDELDENLDYVPGSTEMATQFDMDGKGTDWAQIPDKTGDGNAAFPLSGDGYLVADTMEPCNGKEYSCTDSRLIRFKAIPHMGLPANRIISNMAVIKEEGSAETLWYHTNGNIPLRLRKGVCGTTPLCPELTEEECGGTGPVGDDDSVIGADETASDDDATVADESASDDDATVADADTSKDGGCGCALVF